MSKKIWYRVKIILEAKKYNSRSIFKKNSSGAYKYCVENKLLNDEEIFGHMIRPISKNKKWNLQKIINLAKKYNTKSHFNRDNSGAYSWCIKNNKINNKYIFGHMNIKVKWNFELSKKEAKKYKFRIDFINKSKGSYQWCYANNLLQNKEIFGNFKNIKIWNLKDVILEAKKYSSKSEFINKSNGAYNWCLKNNYHKHKEIFGHMKITIIRYNFDNVVKESKKYKSRKEFSKNSGAYEWCIRNNLLQNKEIFGHMGKVLSGFNMDKPAILYYLNILNGTAYKIGISNRRLNERFNKSEISKIKIIFEKEYTNGYLAFQQEKIILKEFSYAKYTGDALLKNGNTELFSYDILGLDSIYINEAKAPLTKFGNEFASQIEAKHL